MGKERKTQVAQIMKELAAQFLSKEDNRTSLITVTDANVSPDLKQGTIFISVLPANKEQEALNFAKRKRKDIRQHMKKNMNIKTVPFIDIEIDRGEKNRQRIDELLKEH